MGKVIITERVHATPMNLGDYNRKKGWQMPVDENPLSEGYYLIRENGTSTWMSKEIFDECSKEEVEGIVPSKSFRIEQHDRLRQGVGNIGDAIAALKEGKMVCRLNWNGKGLFVFMQVPATIGKDIVPKMQSLPEAVKSIFENRFETEQLDAIYYDNQLALVGPSNLINGWAPSVNDALAEDWYILELSAKIEE